MPAADMRDRRCSTDLVWICDTRLSVTPSTSPISAQRQTLVVVQRQHELLALGELEDLGPS